MDKERPRMLMADADGNILDHENLLMVCRKGDEWRLPAPGEMIPLPAESETFLMPGRRAIGLDPHSGEIQVSENLAVAAFVCPGHTLTAHPAWLADENAPILPLFAYGALGFANERFYVCARRVDTDRRQVFAHIPQQRIEQGARSLERKYPRNRLIRHILDNCVRRYACPAARNFALGRFEAPLPTSRACNARCVGCISELSATSPLPTTPQCRLTFTPAPEEVAQVMQIHAAREKRQPIFSFGQGCEGDPLLNAGLLAQSMEIYRGGGGMGTINCNTNGSLPGVLPDLAKAGLTSIRVSLNSARPAEYMRYYRPMSYGFDDVSRSLAAARELGIFTSINYLFFPGLSDQEDELQALARLVGESGVSMIQWRNLNIDPQWHLDNMGGAAGPSMGLASFMKRLKKACPWIRYGYFNPWLGERAAIEAPMPGQWRPARHAMSS